MSQYPASEEIHFTMNLDLYEELFECEVDSFELDEQNSRGIQVQFVQGMLNAQIGKPANMDITMTQDGFEYLVHVVLPELIDMWYTTDRYTLMKASKTFLESFGLSFPY